MPAGKLRKLTKTYGGVIKAAVAGTEPASVAVSPQNDFRTMLLIQNTGAGDLLVRFGGACLNDGTDQLFPAGSAAGLLWDKPETCPEASINLASVAGTTWAITEQVTR